jgi:hypothetical protein
MVHPTGTDATHIKNEMQTTNSWALKVLSPQERETFAVYSAEILAAGPKTQTLRKTATLTAVHGRLTKLKAFVHTEDAVKKAFTEKLLTTIQDGTYKRPTVWKITQLETWSVVPAASMFQTTTTPSHAA